MHKTILILLFLLSSGCSNDESPDLNVIKESPEFFMDITSLPENVQKRLKAEVQVIDEVPFIKTKVLSAKCGGVGKRASLTIPILGENTLIDEMEFWEDFEQRIPLEIDYDCELVPYFARKVSSLKKFLLDYRQFYIPTDSQYSSKANHRYDSPPVKGEFEKSIEFEKRVSKYKEKNSLSTLDKLYKLDIVEFEGTKSQFYYDADKEVWHWNIIELAFGEKESLSFTGTHQQVDKKISYLDLYCGNSLCNLALEFNQNIAEAKSPDNKIRLVVAYNVESIKRNISSLDSGCKYGSDFYFCKMTTNNVRANVAYMGVFINDNPISPIFNDPLVRNSEKLRKLKKALEFYKNKGSEFYMSNDTELAINLLKAL
jgi:hypothetical protein